jgi:DNA-binding response OmpR family regulator
LSARVLLADDSPHAQRIGARILIEEGFDVEIAKDGREVYPALDRFVPDVVIVDVFLPTRSGFEICHWIKTHPRHKATRVIMTAGLLEPFDEAQAHATGCDAIIKKPFEASEVLRTIRPLAEAAQFSRGLFAAEADMQIAPVTRSIPGPHPVRAEVDPERIHAAVKMALEASMPAIIKEVTERVLVALGH